MEAQFGRFSVFAAVTKQRIWGSEIFKKHVQYTGETTF